LHCKPPAYDCNHSTLLASGHYLASRYVMPLREAFPAAGGGGVLGNKYGVSTERRLLAIIRRVRRCKSLSDEVSGVHQDSSSPPGSHIFMLTCRKLEAAPESRVRQSGEDVIQLRCITHI
jgi:hypothetical protein